jgi:hypothetical protein
LISHFDLLARRLGSQPAVVSAGHCPHVSRGCSRAAVRFAEGRHLAVKYEQLQGP